LPATFFLLIRRRANVSSPLGLAATLALAGPVAVSGALVTAARASAASAAGLSAGTRVTVELALRGP
jgi:hypothetical protein